MVKIYAPDLFQKKRTWKTKERDKFLLENKGIDAALLANDLGLSESFTKKYQQKLGIRPLSGTPRKGVMNYERKRVRESSV